MRSQILFVIVALLAEGSGQSCETEEIGLVGLSAPRAEALEHGLKLSYRVFAIDVPFQTACLEWTADVVVNDVLMVSMDLCSCEHVDPLSALCAAIFPSPDHREASIAVEAIVRPRKPECTLSGSEVWIRARTTVPLSLAELAEPSQEDASPKSFRRGSIAMERICNDLAAPSASLDRKPVLDPTVPVLVSGADSLLPDTVTAISGFLRSVAQHAPHQHVLVCNMGPENLDDHLGAMLTEEERRRISALVPRWDAALSHFMRSLGFRSACLAAALCEHRTALWVDPDLRLRPTVSSVLQDLSRSGHWLVSVSVGSDKAAADAEVSIAQFGFSQAPGEGGAGFDKVFLPFLGEVFDALDEHRRMFQGEGDTQAGAGLNREERTRAGALERRVLSARVKEARRHGWEGHVTDCRAAVASKGGEIGGCGGGEQREPSLGELMRISQTDKLWTHAYDRYYAGRLEQLRHKKGVRVLELGGADGRSLDVWLNFFSAPAAVHVLTLDQVASGRPGSREWACAVHGRERCEAVRFFHGDQGDQEFLDMVLAEGAGLPTGPPFPEVWDQAWEKAGYDLIIDDASHYPPLQIYSLARLLPAVRPGGCFVVEDLETSFWNAKPTTHIYGRWLHGAGVGMGPPGNAVAKLKELVEVLFRWHLGMEHNLTVLGTDADASLFAITFGAGLAILDRATLAQTIHAPRLHARRQFMHTMVDEAGVSRWAESARKTNPF